MALATVGIDLVAKLAELQAGMDKAGRIAAKSAAEIEARYKRMGDAASSVGAALGAAISVAGIVAFVKATTNGLDALNDLKDATGASIENLSALEDIAARTGTSMDTVGTALVKLNSALTAGKAGSETAAAFTAIGLSVEELKRLDPAEALRRIAVALSGYADNGEKARLVQLLFGKSIREVAPLLKDLAEQGSLVAKVTAEQAQAAEDFNKQLFALQKNITDTSRSIVSEMLPALNQLFDRAKREGFLAALFTPTETGRAIAKAEELSLAITNVSNALMRADALSRDESLPGAARRKWEADAKALRTQLEGLQRQAFLTTAAMKGALADENYGHEGLNRPRPGIKLPPQASGAASKAGPGYGAMGPPNPFENMGPALTGSLPDATVAALRAIENTNLAKIAEINAALDELFRIRASGVVGGDATVDQAIEDLREALQKLGPAAEKAAKETKPAFDELTLFAQEASRNIQDALGDTILATMQGTTASIGKMWQDMLLRMVAQAAAAQLNKAIFGSGVGSGGGAASGIGDILELLFNGFSVSPRAAGGPVTGGLPYLVGERGPEIIVPRGSGTVLPNGAGGRGTYQVVVQGDASENTLRLINGALAQFEARMMMRGA